MQEIIVEWLETIVELYLGLPLWAMPIFWVALTVVIGATLSMLFLIVAAQIQINRTERIRKQTVDPAATESDYLWVFMVPALNEAITIRDSISRLEAVDVTHKRMLVINDGSDDETGEILESLTASSQGCNTLTVLTRVPPNARQGKSEALNDAWRYLHKVILGQGKYKDWDPNKVIVTIVDADGRLDPQAGRVARHFIDPEVGGVQSLVRIYNRKRFLTWAQDLEFAVFGFVFQMGRMHWGTSNMGGNGQFNRLAALDSVAVEDSRGNIGPWREGRLTEDQDIGLRMIENGWKGTQSTSVTINQQGLNNLRALYRQRTRWAQGGWQMLDMIVPLMRNKHTSFNAKWDQFWYLLTPVLQSFMGVTVVMTVSFLVFETVEVEWTILIIVVIYALSVAPGVIGVLFARRSLNPLQIILGFILAHAYVLYSWLIYPVVFRALLRHLTGRGTWAKTARETITAEEEPDQIVA